MRRCLLLICFLLVLAVPGTVVHAIEYGGLGGIPANPDPKNPRTKSIFIYTLSPGDSKQDAVKIINNTNKPKTVAVYAVDSELSSGGSFACTQKSDTQKRVGSWIKLDKPEINLPANGEEVIAFRVSVPAGISVGEHNGCIVIQEKTKATEAAGNGVQLSFRSALRTVVTVPGDIVKDAEFSELLIKNEAKKYIITARLHNKGNVSLDTDVKIAVKDWLNRSVYKNGGIYPLLSQKQPIELNFEYPRPFWGGIYRVSGTAAYNGDPNTQLGVDSPKNVIKHAPGKLLLVMPQPLAATLWLIIILLLIAIVRAMSLRQRRRRTLATSWRKYTVRPGDTVVGLARRSRVPWRTIARVNKLKAPYELRPGSTVKLPTSVDNKKS